MKLPSGIASEAAARRVLSYAQEGRRVLLLDITTRILADHEYVVRDDDATYITDKGRALLLTLRLKQ